MYADDLKLYHVVHSPRDTFLLLKDLRVIYSWSAENDLLLNIDKCHVISFTKRADYEEALSCVELIADLGILFDTHLSFRQHLEYVNSKALKSLYFVMRSTREFTSISAIIHLYKTLVLPNLTFGQ